MQILFLSAWFPYPPNNGSKLRIYNLLRGLAEKHEITLISFADQPGIDPDVPELKDLCRKIRVVPVTWFNPGSLRARLAIFSPKPRSIIDTFSPQMAETIAEEVHIYPFDLVIASQTRMAGYRPSFRRLPALFEEVEVGVLYGNFAEAVNRKERLRHGLTWLKHRNYLAGLLRQYAASTVASQTEQELLQKLTITRAVDNVVVIPNCIDVTTYTGVMANPRPNTLIYTGSFSFTPNYEAMLWFINRVLPLVQAQIPDVHLTITGDKAERPLPESSGISHVGFVDDIRTFVASSWISLAPLQTGGGTRLKILEAMALKTPVVATTKGAQGLEGRDGEHFLLADAPQEFAAAVVRLLQDNSLRQKLTENAYQLVKMQYDWTAVSPRLLHLVNEVVHAAR